MNMSIMRKSRECRGGRFLCGFIIAIGMLPLTASARNIYITPDADGTGNGSSWNSPMMLTNYLTAANIKHGDVVRLKSGHYTAKINSATFGNYVTVKISGGYAGTDDNSLDPAFPYSDIDFANYPTKSIFSPLVCKAKEGRSLTLERLHLRGARSTAIYKQNAGDLHLSDCVVVSNGWRNYSGNTAAGGRGLLAQGGSVTIDKCTFAYNGMYFGAGDHTTISDHGYGVCLKSTTARLTGCTFIGNGAKISDEAPVSSIRGGGRGLALYASSAKVYAKECDFLCNRGALGGYSNSDNEADAQGGIVVLSGNCNGSWFTNCSWVANQNLRDTTYNGNVSYGGVLTLDMSGRNYTVDVDRCTFAYNITDSANAAAGIDVRNGTLNLSNSEFVGNYARTGNKLGVDLVVRTNGTANVAYCLFPAMDGTHITVEETGDDKGELTMTGIVLGDADLATDQATALSLVKTRTAEPYLVYDPSRIDEVLAFDVHPRSRTGRWTAGGFVKDKVHSPSIDAGDPDAPYGSETEPNGGRLNLGRYGGTVEASQSRKIEGFLVIVR